MPSSRTLRAGAELPEPPSRHVSWPPLTAALLLPVFGLLAGCGSGGDTVTPPAPCAAASPVPPPVPEGQLVNQPGWTVQQPTKALAQKKWTFLVYLNAANNLEQDGDLNVNQMESIGSTNDVNIVVQWKRLGGQHSPYRFNWSGTRRYYIQKDADTTTVSSPQIASSSSIDMGDPNSLQAFVQWGVAAYPAQHYCLVLWNHGAGWRAAQRTTRVTRATPLSGGTRGFSYDDATGHHIETNQIPGAVAIGNYGLRWDVLAFDASLMQMEEVAYELRDKAAYIAGSEESPDERGYPYDSILGHLTASPDLDPLPFAKQIAQDTFAFYGPSSDSTQSVLDACRVAQTAPAIDQMGRALQAAQGAWGTQISAARRAAESYGHGDSAYADYKDLTDFLDRLTAAQSGGQPYINDPGVLSAAQSVRDALGSAIAFNIHGGGHPNSHGLAIFLPTPARYAAIDAQQASGHGPSGGNLRYTSLSFAQAAPGWVNFLQNGPN